MKNLNDLLRQKELSIKRLQQDIEAIRTVMAMLEESEQSTNTTNTPESTPAASLATTPATTVMYSAASQNTRAAEPPKVKRDWP